MSHGPTQQPVELFDSDGNPLETIVDNSIRRLQTRGSVIGQTAGAGAEKKVTVIDDVTTATHKRLQVEADIKPGATIIASTTPGSPVTQIASLLLNGGSPNMNVNGSVTPVVYSFPADATKDIVLSKLQFVATTGALNFDGSNFGKGGGALTNGVLVEAIVNNGTLVTLGNLQRNEDFARLSGEFFTELGGTNDLLVAALSFGGRSLLKAATGDLVRVTIRDDLTAVARDIKYLTGTFYGTKE